MTASLCSASFPFCPVAIQGVAAKTSPCRRETPTRSIMTLFAIIFFFVPWRFFICKNFPWAEKHSIQSKMEKHTLGSLHLHCEQEPLPNSWWKIRHLLDLWNVFFHFQEAILHQKSYDVDTVCWVCFSVHLLLTSIQLAPEKSLKCDCRVQLTSWSILCGCGFWFACFRSLV